MQQKLIVEGKNDAIVIATVLMERKSKPPSGYADRDKYIKEFVNEAGTINEIKTILREQLESPDVERIGIVVDANGNDVTSRIDMINSEVTKYGLQKSEENRFTWYATEQNSPLQVSLWVMPNNKSKGYLEHFLYDIIPNKYNAAKEHASETVEAFYSKDEVHISEVKKQKAKTYAYLALMEKPGLSLGTAVTANYFDAKHINSKELEDWFKHSFILEK